MDNLPTEILTVIGEYIPMGKTKKERWHNLASAHNRIVDKTQAELIDMVQRNPTIWGFEKYKETEKSLIMKHKGTEKGYRFSKDLPNYNELVNSYTKMKLYKEMSKRMNGMIKTSIIDNRRVTEYI